MDVNIIVENTTQSPYGLVEYLYEANDTADLLSYKKMLAKLVERNNKTSCIDEFTNVVDVSTPNGFVPIIGLKYDKLNAVSANLKVFYSSTDLGNVGDTITGSVSGATATIHYEEMDTYDTTSIYKYLVEVTSGTFTDADVEITKRISVTLGASNIFSNFSGKFKDASVDVNIAEYSKEDANEFKVVTEKSEYEVITKQAKNNITKEYIQDIIRVFKTKGIDTVISIIDAGMNMEIEQTAFKYLRSIATIQNDITLTRNVTELGAIRESYYNIYSRINGSIGRISTNTNISNGYFVIASSNIVGALKTILKIEPYTKKEDTNVVGYLPNGAILIEDSFSLIDYIVVGTKGVDNIQNGGLLYTPYTYDLITATNTETMQEVLVPMQRFDLVRNKLDTKIDESGSDFFEVTYVDMGTITI